MSLFPNNGNNGSPIGPIGGANDYGINGMARAIPVIDISAVMRLVYVWMGLGLLITAFTALFISTNTAVLESLLANPGMIWGAIIAQLAVVLVISFALSKLSPSLAGILFLVYSALTGVTIGIVVSFYTAGSVASAFATTSVLFGVMTVFAFTTKMDLSKWGTFLLMGLVGLIVATLLNVFIFRSAGFDLVLSYFGVLLFTVLTAYDTYQIKKMAESPEFAMSGNDNILKLSIIGALKLYLDFINLFLYLLRIFGSSRD
ncbi:MAG: Bax inhibitor-1/YccA family protein [Anaerolineae bacterium]|nr:Bax inhibitor-1/YccA family protein [Anaerolineae bacterium]